MLSTDPRYALLIARRHAPPLHGQSSTDPVRRRLSARRAVASWLHRAAHRLDSAPLARTAG